MPHLQRLPDEILLFIIENLSSSKDVAALSIQFRRMHQVCAPDLAKRRRYRRIRIRKDEHLNPAFEILLSILRKPYLGTYVRHLEVDRQPVHSCAYRKVEKADCLRSLSASDLDLVKKAVGRLPSLRYNDDVFLTKDVLFNMVMQRKIDISPPGHRSSFYANNTDRAVFIGQAIAVLLMSVCPKLESLVLGAPFIVDDGIVDPSEHHLWYRTVAFPLDRFLNSVTSSDDESAESHWGLEPGGPYLQEVRNIEFLPRPYLSSKWYSPCDIRSCLDITQDLPNLQAISVDGMKDFDESYFRYHLGRNNIQNIRLHRSLVGTGVLVRLICAPRKLREFTYTSGYVDYMPLAELGGRYGHVGRRAHESEDPYTFNTPWFIGGILNHKKTLETLELDCDYQFQKDGSSRPVSRWLQSPPWSLGNHGSLKDFTALTCLDVGVEMFFVLVKGAGPDHKSETSDLIDQLPPKLHSLTIRGYEKGKDPERDRQLENLEHGVNSGLYPRLKEVRGIRERIPAGTYALRETWLGGEDPDFTLDDWTDYDE